MRLSLWMIANRLEQYDIEARISPTTERTIGGPLPVSTLQSLYIRKEGFNVVCSSEQGTITIYGVTEDEGFLLIQSIFNWYDEWLERIEATIRDGDGRRFVHLCAQAFENPVLFLDANKCLSGMDCRGIDVNTIPEWRYISEKGQISIPWYSLMTQALNDPVRTYGHSVVRFWGRPQGGSDREANVTGLHAQFRYRSEDYGTITVLDRKRRLNLGDVATLELLAERSSMFFAASDRKISVRSNSQIMNELLEFKPVSREQLDFARSIITGGAPGGDDEFGLFLFHYAVEKGRSDLTKLLQSVIFKRYPDAFSWIYRDDLLVISNVRDNHARIREMMEYAASQGYSEGLHAAVSLPFNDLRDTPYFYEQASFAVSRLDGPGYCNFYDCAVAYLLETADPKRREFACEPGCRRAWEGSPESRKNLQTMGVYLQYERSPGPAAEDLFIHKNTLSYRIRNMRENNGWDLEDPALRDYLRLSIYFLSR